MGCIEADMKTRVRVGGKDEDRVTGNMVAYRVTHRDTRISADDQMPDMSLAFDHVFVLNATYDPVEHKWKAAQIGEIKHDAPYYEAIYITASPPTSATSATASAARARRSRSPGIDRQLIEKFSRRTAVHRAGGEEARHHQPAVARPSSARRPGWARRRRLADDLNGYYVSRLTDAGTASSLADLQGQPSYVSDDGKAVEFAIGHMFEREERGGRAAAVRDGPPARHRLGDAGRRDGGSQAAGRAVKGRARRRRGRCWRRRARIIDFAREGRGTCGRWETTERPRDIGYAMRTERMPASQVTCRCRHTRSTRSGRSRHSLTLPRSKPTSALDSPPNSAIARHVWDSTDQVILIRGPPAPARRTP